MDAYERACQQFWADDFDPDHQDFTAEAAQDKAIVAFFVAAVIFMALTAAYWSA
jgi:hypothetical protein